MRDNFSKGIYPTLHQRLAFAKECCDYVQEQREQSSCRVCLVSFSFVNKDLKDAFRERFPESHWILIHTNERQAQDRIEQRQGHFYKGSKINESKDELRDDKTGKLQADDNNTEWKFDPVKFDHKILDGLLSVEENSKRLIEIIEDDL